MWADMCINGIPQITDMCTADYSTVPADVELWDVCWRMSSAWVPEYDDIVSKDICDLDNGQYFCVYGEPVKAEICALWDTTEGIEEYVNMSKEDLCGFTDDDGTVYESMVDTICNEWEDTCTNGIPSF